MDRVLKFLNDVLGQEKKEKEHTLACRGKWQVGAKEERIKRHNKEIADIENDILVIKGIVKK